MKNVRKKLKHQKSSNVVHSIKVSKQKSYREIKVPIFDSSPLFKSPKLQNIDEVRDNWLVENLNLEFY